jgi:hypothetical protein
MVYWPTRTEIDAMREIHALVGEREFRYHEIKHIFPYPMGRMQRFEDQGWFKSRKAPKDAQPRLWRFTHDAIGLLNGDRYGHRSRRRAQTPASVGG